MERKMSNAKHTPGLDICISANSNLVHIEERVSGRNIATMTMKGATREEKIVMAMKFSAAEDMLDALETFYDPSRGSFTDKARTAIAKARGKI
jgi:hypothetical protein